MYLWIKKASQKASTQSVVLSAMPHKQTHIFVTISDGKCMDFYVLPVLRKDKELFWIVEFLQNIGKELTPPALASTELHQQQTSVKPNFRCPTDTKVFEEFLTGLGMEGTLEDRGHWVAWKYTDG